MSFLFVVKLRSWTEIIWTISMALTKQNRPNRRRKNDPDLQVCLQRAPKWYHTAAKDAFVLEITATLSRIWETPQEKRNKTNKQTKKENMALHKIITHSTENQGEKKKLQSHSNHIFLFATTNNFHFQQWELLTYNKWKIGLSLLRNWCEWKTQITGNNKIYFYW